MSYITEPYINGNVDLDHLHKIISEGTHWRRNGKTFATLMLMLGEAQLGDPGNRYLYLGENVQHTKDVCRDFVNLVQFDIGTPMVSATSDTVFVSERNKNVDQKYYQSAPLNETMKNGQSKVFMFRSITISTADTFRGIRLDDVFVDITEETADKYREVLTNALARKR